MVRAEPWNNYTAGIDTNHSTCSRCYLNRTQRYMWTKVDTVRIEK